MADKNDKQKGEKNMKYCSVCGKELNDDASYCDKCGARTSDVGANDVTRNENGTVVAKHDETLSLVAKILMILSCIGGAIALIPLAWCIPMTVSYWRAVEENRPVSTGFKVCTLIFVNIIAGILMLCDDKN